MGVHAGPGRGLRSVRLSDVPEGIRLRALDKLLKTSGTQNGMLVPSQSLTDRLALGAAATHPSDRIYWVSKTAYDRVFVPRGRHR